MYVISETLFEILHVFISFLEKWRKQRRTYVHKQEFIPKDIGHSNTLLRLGKPYSKEGEDRLEYPRAVKIFLRRKQQLPDHPLHGLVESKEIVDIPFADQ